MELEALVDNLDLAIVRFDEAGRGARVNPAGAALLGREPAGVGGLGWLDLFHPEDRPVARASYHAMREGGRAELEARLLTPARTFEARVLLVRATDAAGRFSGHHFVAHDLTAERLREERIRELEALVARQAREGEELFSIAAHELDEPVRKVAAFAELLREGSSERLDEAGRDYLARIGRAAKRMAALLHDLRALSRVATATLPMAPVDLGEAAREAVLRLGDAVRETGARIEIGQLPVVVADVAQVEQLLSRLVENAIRFRRPGEPPVVRIAATEEDGASGPVVRLTVSDEGMGFDPAHAERIFQPFLRLHGRGVHEGSGLGLAICRRIVARHGGRIEAHGEPGAGATFVVTLPRG